MSERPLFTSKFDNHIFYDLSPFSLAGIKMDVWMMMHVCKLETLPKDIAQNKGLFIDFKGLHIVQHIIIISVKSLHLLVVILHFLDEI